MAARKIQIGFLRYRGVDGKSHLGFHGEDVDVHKDDVKRFDELNKVEAPAVAETTGTSISQADVDAAVSAAEAARDAELAEAKAELAREREAFDAEKAEFEQARAATPAKTTAAKQS